MTTVSPLFSRPVTLPERCRSLARYNSDSGHMRHAADWLPGTWNCAHVFQHVSARSPHWNGIVLFCRIYLTDAPGISDAGTISRFSSGQRLRGRAVAVVPITSFVDTSRPHDTKHHIRLGDRQRFGKEVPDRGLPCNGRLGKYSAAIRANHGGDGTT